MVLDKGFAPEQPEDDADNGNDFPFILVLVFGPIFGFMLMQVVRLWT